MCHLQGFVNDVIAGKTTVPAAGRVIGKHRMCEDKVRQLSTAFMVEFALVYITGKRPNKVHLEWPNGGAGSYKLFKGQRSSVDVEIGVDTFFICHTHPGGTEEASEADMAVLKYYHNMRWRLKSSLIYPLMKRVFRFTKDKKYIKF